jgi:predicted transcriptional regulator
MPVREQYISREPVTTDQISATTKRLSDLLVQLKRANEEYRVASNNQTDLENQAREVRKELDELYDRFKEELPREIRE